LIRKVIFITIFALTCYGKGFLNYSQSVDILNFFDYLSLNFGSNQEGLYQSAWIKKFGKFTDEEKSLLKDYREMRSKYKVDNQDFDHFSLSFLKAKSIDEALKNLSKTLSKEELSKIVKLLKHFKGNASSFIAESSSFKGKAPEIENRLKKSGVLKAYQDVFKFFGFKNNLQARIFFVWAPKEFAMEIENLQNVLIIKVNPLEDIDKKLDDDRALQFLIESLFSTLTNSQLDNFKKVLNSSCPSDSFNTLTYVLGPMHLKHRLEKKSYDPYVKHFSDPKINLLTITFHHLFEEQLASRKQFSGSFSNKLEYLCSLAK